MATRSQTMAYTMVPFHDKDMDMSVTEVSESTTTTNYLTSSPVSKSLTPDMSGETNYTSHSSMDEDVLESVAGDDHHQHAAGEMSSPVTITKPLTRSPSFKLHPDDPLSKFQKITLNNRNSVSASQITIKQYLQDLDPLATSERCAKKSADFEQVIDDDAKSSRDEFISRDMAKSPRRHTVPVPLKPIEAEFIKASENGNTNSQISSSSNPYETEDMRLTRRRDKQHVVESPQPASPVSLQPSVQSKQLHYTHHHSTHTANHLHPHHPYKPPPVSRTLTFPMSHQHQLQHQQENAAVNNRSNDSVENEIERMRNSILLKRNNIKKRRRELLEDEGVLVGNKVSEGHANFVMAYNMLTGIRVAVSRCSGIMKPLTDADFKTTKKLSFGMDGTELTPSSKYDFKFKDYAPEVFRELRTMFGIDPAEYLVSVTGKYILSELSSPGKSGSFFYYSRDFRFIIKTIHHSEHKQLKRILKQYYNHVKQYPNTLISQFYGLHRVKMPGFSGKSRKVHFVVMNNLFPPHRDIHVKYDLKGSTFGRITKVDESTSLLGPKKNGDITLKDLNWLENQQQINFGPEKRQKFLNQLNADVKLLEKLNVMDYSLLLGVHDVKLGNKDEITNKRYSIFEPVSHDKKSLIKTNPRNIDRLSDLPVSEYPDREKFVFYGDDGGIRASGDHDEPLNEIYYLGIIDCLTNYSMKKRLETYWRSLNHSRKTISSLPAVEYGERFLRFIKKGVKGN